MGYAAMKADVLLSITGAKGLGVPIESAKKLDGLAESLRKDKALQSEMTRLSASGRLTTDSLVRLLTRSRLGAAGKNTDTAKAPEWTHAEAAQAAGGVELRHWYALLYTYRLDDSAFWLLRGELIRWCQRVSEPRKWPETVKNEQGQDRTYFDELVMLMLMEVKSPSSFMRQPNKPELRRLIMNVHEHTWRRHLSPIYEDIHREFLIWIAVAKSVMNPKLEEEG